MLRIASLTVLVSCVWLGSPAAAQKAAPKVEDLIAQLGSDDFATRNAASLALFKLGQSALPALRKASKDHPQVEVRRRAAALVEAIEKRLVTERLLSPKRVHLKFKDTPVLQAIDRLAKQTGYTIRFTGDRAGLAERRITLDIGPVPFWEALHAFCEKARVHESVPAPPQKPQPKRNGNSITIIGGIGGAGNVKTPPADIMKITDKDKPGEILLSDGAPPARPSHVAGNVRIKALPAGTSVPHVSVKAGEVLLALEATTEPNLIWKDVVAVRVDQAIDDRDRPLAQRWLNYKSPAPPANNSSTGVVMINGNVITPGMAGDADNPAVHLAPIVLKTTEPARKLKTLNGVISALVLSPPETLITVDNILKAGGKSFKADFAGFMRIDEVTVKDGEVHIKLDVEPPVRSLNEPVSRPNLNMNILINGKPIGGPQAKNLGAANFALLDKDGKPFEVIRAVGTNRGSGALQAIELVYRLPPGQVEPARFTYRDRRAFIVDVPFALKNVTLP